MVHSNENFSPTTFASFYIDIPTKTMGIHTINCSVLNKSNHKAVTENSFWSAEAELLVVRKMAFRLANALGYTLDTDTCRQCKP